MTVHETLEAIEASRVVAIVREPSADSAKREVERLLTAGVRAIEVSLSTPGALDVARWMAEHMGGNGVHCGLGTVLTVRDVKAAADAGSSFIVSPISRAGLITTCQDLGLASIVGAMTPTECVIATEYGADLLKLFPATLWTLEAIKGLLQALPLLKIVPTGGIRLAQAIDWLDAGAVAVGLGGGLRTDGPIADLRGKVSALARDARVGTA